MAINKGWPIINSMRGVHRYNLKTEKVNPVAAYIKNEFGNENIFKYMADPAKTNEREFVSGVNCNVNTALEMFKGNQDRWERERGVYTCRRKVRQKDPDKESKYVEGTIVGYHWIQSFDPRKDDVNYEQAHEIGIEFANNFGGKYAAIVCTHVDRGHIHNHIFFSAWDIETGKKFPDNNKQKAVLRKVNDEICLKHGLSIIEAPEKGSYKDYKKFLKNPESESWVEGVKRDILNTMKEVNNWEEYRDKMTNELNYSIREGKYITHTTPDGAHKIRDVRLGKEYTKEKIEEYFKAKKEMSEEVKEVLEYNTQKNSWEKRKEEEHFQKEFYVSKKINTKTKSPYTVKKYDKFGRKRTGAEMLLLLAAVIIKNEGEKWQQSGVRSTEDKAIHSRTNYKLQEMMDRIKTVRERNILDEVNLTLRLKDVGSKWAVAKQHFEKLSKSVNKMSFMASSLDFYLEKKEICERILSMKEGPEREALLSSNAELVNKYEKAKAVLQKHDLISPEDIKDFRQRWDKLNQKTKEAETLFKGYSEEYRELKKVERSLSKAVSDEYIYGPLYVEQNKKADFPEGQSLKAELVRMEKIKAELIMEISKKPGNEAELRRRLGIIEKQIETIKPDVTSSPHRTEKDEEKGRGLNQSRVSIGQKSR